MILAKHEQISDVFGKGLGKTIQRLDSDIAFEIIVTLMDEGILCLPIHDSFIVESSAAPMLQDAMDRAINQKRIGGSARLTGNGISNEIGLSRFIHQRKQLLN